MPPLTKLQLKIADHRQALLGARSAVPASKLTVPERVQGLPPGPTRALAVIRANAEAFRDKPSEIAPTPYPKLFELIDKHTAAFMRFGESDSVQAVDLLVGFVKTHWETEMSSANLARIDRFLDQAELIIPAVSNLAMFSIRLESSANLAFARGFGPDLLNPMFTLIRNLMPAFKRLSESEAVQAEELLVNAVKTQWAADMSSDNLARLEDFLTLMGHSIPAAADLDALRSEVDKVTDLIFKNGLKPELLTSQFSYLLFAKANNGVLEVVTKDHSHLKDHFTDHELHTLTLYLKYSRQPVNLKLSHCYDITDWGLAHLRGLTNLSSLSIVCPKQVTDRGLAHVAELTGLSSLTLWSCDEITDQGLAHLAALTNLTSLNLFNCGQITDRGMAHIAVLTDLSSLNIGSSKHVTDQGLASLKALTKLSHLDLSYNTRITGQGLAQLSSLAELSTLRINSCKQLTDDDLSYLTALPALHSLDLTYCAQITDQGLAHLAKLTNLSSLKLYNCDQITDQGLAHLKALTNLASLSLAACKHITDNGVAHLKALTNLASLDLAVCFITDQGLAHLAALPNLSNLDLQGCHLVTDRGLAHLKALKKLTVLKLGGCVLITNRGMRHLKTLTNLTSLDLDKCKKLSYFWGLRHLKALKKLTYLGLRECNQITWQDAEKLRKAIPGLSWVAR
jgi:hypothetical protein